MVELTNKEVKVMMMKSYKTAGRMPYAKARTEKAMKIYLECKKELITRGLK
tara:strand:- start:651 stop:803 length:153 start_codon:yes stop_codon:yes gene_type:complete